MQAFSSWQHVFFIAPKKESYLYGLLTKNLKKTEKIIIDDLFFDKKWRYFFNQITYDLYKCDLLNLYQTNYTTNITGA